MLKRLTYNDDIGEHYRYSGTSSIAGLRQNKLESTAFENIAPVNMTAMENSDMKITTSKTNISHPLWKCFDGDDDTYANIGSVYSDSYTATFQFKTGKKNICFVELKLGTNYTGTIDSDNWGYIKGEYSNNPFAITMYGSSDDENWTNLGSVSNAVSNYENYGNFYYHEDNTTGYYSPFLGTFLFNFKNQDAYLFYKLVFTSGMTDNYYYYSNDIYIKRMRFFPYCQKPLHRYLLTENSADLNNWCNGTDIAVNYGAYFGKQCAIFGSNGDSSITLSPTCTYWFNQLTVSFEVCFTDDLPSQSSIVSKTENSGWNIEVARNDEQLTFKYYLRIGNTYYIVTYASTMSAMKDQWHQFFLTYDGELQCLYIDGELVGSTKCRGSINHNDNYYLNVGCEPTASSGHENFFKGGIRELCLYYFALTREQIIKKFNNWNQE